MLVEVGTIITAAARAHHVKAWQVRDGADDERVAAARRQAFREMRQAGLALRDIGEFMGCAHTAVANACRDIDVGDRGRTAPKMGKRCSRCHQLLPLDAYARNRRSTDLRQSHCRVCNREVDRAYRGRQAHHRKAGGDRVQTHVRLNTEVHRLVKDTAVRHEVSMALVIERAVTRAMACVDCRRRLRTVGSDFCALHDPARDLEGVA